MRFASPLYSGLAMYSPGLFLSMATSRLLLSIKASETMRNNTAANSAAPVHPQGLAFATIAQYSGPSDDGHGTLYKSQHHGESYTIGTSEMIPPQGENVRTQTTFLKKRVWWLFGATYNTGVVTLVEFERTSDVEENGLRNNNGLQVSRLGRYDHWL